MKSSNLPIVSANSGVAEHLPREVRPMPDSEQQATQAPSGMNLYEILFMLFRHKWKIISLGLAGLLAAGAVYLVIPPVYQSDAKLFVRYVLDKSAVDGMDPQIKTPNPQTDSLVNSEVEILTSQDLAQQVAEAVGIDKILPNAGSKDSLEQAIQVLSQGLSVSTVKGTNIIDLSFRSADPKLSMPVLQEWVKRYFDKHLEVHRSVGAFEFVAKETEELRLRLSQTEEELRQLKEKAGVISLAESRAALAKELGKAQEELDSASAETAAQKARVAALEQSLALVDKNQSGPKPQPLSPSIIQKYQSLGTQLTQLQQSETDLLSRYTAENHLVKIKSSQIGAIQKQRQDLEKKYPAIAGMVAAGSGTETARPDIVSERARLIGLQSRSETLSARVNELQVRARLVEESAPRIEQLERQKELEEASYKHSEASLEKARIDETLDPSRIPNISVVETPTPALKVKRDVQKLMLALAGGGIAVGFALALLIEMVLDRSVKRSLELEKRLQIPVLLSIPYLAAGNRRLRLTDAGQDAVSTGQLNTGDEIVPNASGELLRPFCEAIRDRLGVFFELNSMRHKPKLVAVTSLAADAGASTLAAGLVDAISETAEGKVLFVDKVTAPKRFFNMMADFKGSNLDYVVFDMAPVGDVSSTLPLAGFMDTVLLVVEAEKSNRDAVKRAYAQLSAKTKVSVVFNKSRSYGPKWLEGEI
jgi:uncharacterized protein involved in exopolysaccharide biosynthesis/Mrp family chromosome partitioning ATPase